MFEGLCHQAQSVGGVDLAPCLPAEHRGGVEQHHAPDGGVQCGVEERQATESELLHGVVAAQGGGGDLRGELGLDGFHHGAKEPLLRGEMVRQRPPGHPGAYHDLLLAGPGESMFGEQLAPGIEEGAAGGGPAFGLAPAPARSGGVFVDSHGLAKYKCVQPACK